jgi:hypothetical protein
MVLSEGQVNIFNLAKNAGTSVGQMSASMLAICRFRAVLQESAKRASSEAPLSFL